MRKRINTDEMEDYLKDVADTHRMYPSNQIWTNIRENLHGNPRWPALTFISLFIITSLVIGTIFIKPDENILNRITSKQIASDTKQAENNFAEIINPDRITSNTVDRILNNRVAAPVSNNDTAVPIYKQVDNSLIATNEVRVKSTIDIPFLNFTEHELFIIAPTNKEQAELAVNVRSEEEKKEVETEKVQNKEASLTLAETIILPKIKPSRWEVGFYITPSSSFRRITDDNRTKPAVTNIVPVNSNMSVDVNEVIRHKAAMGVEAGFAFGYKLTSQLKLKAGLQLNIRQYDIEAYGTATELVRLSINNGSGVETLDAISNYRNGNGAYEVTLNNKYHEFSLPLSVEWTNTISKKVSWGVSAGIQPTYIFGKQAYIISTDYKNYTNDVPLFRNWNLNTAVDAHIAYKAGKYTWRLGPQVRYQQLSSYSQKYPIKENLYDYGVKFGFTKTIR